MRRPVGFSAAETDAFYAALLRPHDPRVVATVETVNRAFVGECKVLAGQVDGRSEDNQPERVAALTLYDPDGIFDGPSMNLQVRLDYEVPVSSLGKVASVPLYTGVVVRPPTRNGAEVALETQDRSTLLMRGRPKKSYPADQLTALTIRYILTDCGETRFDRLPSATTITDRNEDPVNIGEEDDLRPLVQINALAASLDRHFYYDAEGYPRLEQFPDGAGLDLSDFVTSQGDVEPPGELVNRVKVIGKRPADHTVVRTLDDVQRGHPLGPSALAVNGVAQNFTVEETNSKLDTKGKVTARADRLIRQYANQLRESHTFNLVPVPTLDLFDVVDLGTASHVVRSFSFPLTAAGDMTLGYRTPLGR